MRPLLGIVLALLPLAAAIYLWRRASAVARVPRRNVVFICLGGIAVALGALWLERFVLGWTGLSVRSSVAGTSGALLATFLLVAPLEEGLKVLVVWPLYAARHLETRRLGVIYAGCAGAGFASAEALIDVWLAPPEESLYWLRVAVAPPAPAFF
ncbi:MAG TPA: PrsW family glutamic-type intramembrane protease, partial [Polyangiaceae bacterium]|nr:PrsW family glutamic-type intramembrane protease [Polyangiaceae bacterium]